MYHTYDIVKSDKLIFFTKICNITRMNENITVRYSPNNIAKPFMCIGYTNKSQRSTTYWLIQPESLYIWNIINILVSMLRFPLFCLWGLHRIYHTTFCIITETYTVYEVTSQSFFWLHSISIYHWTTNQVKHQVQLSINLRVTIRVPLNYKIVATDVVH